MNYLARPVRLLDELARIYPLWERHYGEMQARLERDGLPCSPFAPRTEQYVRTDEEGWLVALILEHGEQAVGYAQGYITNDMHNGDLIAQEDAIYVVPEHRGSAGRILLDAVHAELRRRGVKRLNITTGTDLRASKWFERRGYKHVAHCMSIEFRGASPDVFRIPAKPA